MVELLNRFVVVVPLSVVPHAVEEQSLGQLVQLSLGEAVDVVPVDLELAAVWDEPEEAAARDPPDRPGVLSLQQHNVRPGHADHLIDTQNRPGQVVQTTADHDHVKTRVFKGQLLGVGHGGGDPWVLLSQAIHRVGRQVRGCNARAPAGEALRLDTRPAANGQHALAGQVRADHVDGPVNLPQFQVRAHTAPRHPLACGFGPVEVLIRLHLPLLKLFEMSRCVGGSHGLIGFDGHAIKIVQQTQPGEPTPNARGFMDTQSQVPMLVPMAVTGSTPGSELVGCYKIAGVLTLRISVKGSNRLARPIEQLLGLMATEHTDKPDIDCVVSPMGGAASQTNDNDQGGHTFNQSYKGGRWRMWVSSLEPPCRVNVSVDRLGRVMYLQAGLMSLLRLILGLRGVAWLHGCCLVRQSNTGPQRAVVLAGPSGVGKSQIVARAVSNGWSYVTDDHALVSEAGVSGVSMPLLLRGYGGTPRGLNMAWPVRAGRWVKSMAYKASGGWVNLFTAVPLGPSNTLASPPFLSCPTDVCFIEHGQSVGCRPVSQTEMLDRLEADWRSTGQFADELAANATGDAMPVSMPSFWDQQRRIVEQWITRCNCATATVPKRLQDRDCTQLLSELSQTLSTPGVPA